MYCNQQITDTLFWTGVNDRRKQLFENLWPLPGGVSYNSFLIRDQKCALMDTVEAGSDRGYLDWIGSVLGDRPLDYLIIHHMELDHSGEIENLLQRYPDVKIVGNIKTFKVLCGYLGQLPNLVEVKDGDTLDLGHHRLKFIFTPWVHWPETMMTYDQTDGILFTGDAFGSFGALDGGVFDDQVVFSEHLEAEMRRYYSNIVGKYSNMVQKALAKLSGEISGRSARCTVWCGAAIRARLSNSTSGGAAMKPRTVSWWCMPRCTAILRRWPTISPIKSRMPE